MQVTVKLYASFSVGRFTSALCEYPDGTTISSIVQTLGIPTDRLIQLRNYDHVPFDAVVQDGDTVSLLPLLGGG